MDKVVMVLGFSVTALGTLRSLRKLKKLGYKIYLAGVRDGHTIALSSNIPHRKIVLEASSLYEGLLSIGEEFSSKPVLLFTQDDQVVELSDKQKKLAAFYSFLLPEAPLVELLMEKGQFSEFAANNQLAIPQTQFVKTAQDLRKAGDRMDFPLIIKPYLLHAEKANNPEELAAIADQLKDIHYRSCIVQEYIEGEDDNLYFCFLLFNQDSGLVSSMVAQKLRQWPIAHGTTSLARTVENEDIRKEVAAFYSSVQLKGFVSIEYKYDQKNQRYLIMEPTVGRFNQQVALTKACGINFPERLVRLLYGESFEEEKKQTNDVYWIYESNDWFSFHNSRPRKYPYLRNFFRHHENVLFDPADPLPLFHELRELAGKRIRKIIRKAHV